MGKEKAERKSQYWEREIMKMKSSSCSPVGGSNNNKRRLSCKALGGFLKEARGRLYIFRRCIVMLLCWHD